MSVGSFICLFRCRRPLFGVLHMLGLDLSRLTTRHCSNTVMTKPLPVNSSRYHILIEQILTRHARKSLTLVFSRSSPPSRLHPAHSQAVCRVINAWSPSSRHQIYVEGCPFGTSLGKNISPNLWALGPSDLQSRRAFCAQPYGDVPYA